MSSLWRLRLKSRCWHPIPARICGHGKLDRRLGRWRAWGPERIYREAALYWGPDSWRRSFTALLGP